MNVTWSRARFVLPQLLAGLLLLSCGEEDDGGDAGEGNMSENGGEGSCVRPSGLQQVMAPANLSDGSVIYRMVLDGEHLYFASINTLYRVPKGGGAREELWTAGELALNVPFWVRADDVLVLKGRQLLSVPKGGGAASQVAMLPEAPQVRLDGRTELLLDGNTAYYKTSPVLVNDDEPVSYYRVDLASGTTTLLTSSTTVKTGVLGKVGNYLYTAVRDPSLPEESSSSLTPARSTLFRIPIAGGAPEVVSTELDDGTHEFAFGLIGTDPQSLLVSAAALPRSQNDTSQIAKSGVYRINLSDGRGEQLFDTIALFNLQTEHTLVGGANYIRSLETSDVFYKIPVGSSSTETLFCVDDEVHSSTTDGQHYYLSIYDDGDGTSGIYRRAL